MKGRARWRRIPASDRSSWSVGKPGLGSEEISGAHAHDPVDQIRRAASARSCTLTTSVLFDEGLSQVRSAGLTTATAQKPSGGRVLPGRQEHHLPFSSRRYNRDLYQKAFSSSLTRSSSAEAIRKLVEGASTM